MRELRELARQSGGLRQISQTNESVGTQKLVGSVSFLLFQGRLYGQTWGGKKLLENTVEFLRFARFSFFFLGRWELGKETR
jgi:hypothetical protein